LTNAPGLKIEFWPREIVVGGLVGGPQTLAKAPGKKYFGARQQLVVKDRDHFKSQSS
jgi:hypothetical protein